MNATRHGPSWSARREPNCTGGQGRKTSNVGDLPLQTLWIFKAVRCDLEMQLEGHMPRGRCQSYEGLLLTATVSPPALLVPTSSEFQACPASDSVSKAGTDCVLKTQETTVGR